MDIKPSNYNDFSDINSLRQQANAAPEAAVAPTAKKFEAVFVQMMLKSMRDTVPQDGMFSSQDVQTYQSMLDGQYALNIADHGGIGLARLITKQVGAQVATSVASNGSHSGLAIGKSTNLAMTPASPASPALAMAPAVTALRLQMQRSSSTGGLAPVISKPADKE